MTVHSGSAVARPRAGGDGRLWGDGFELETLVSIRVAKAGLVVSVVPGFESPRLRGAGNLNSLSDGRRLCRAILAERRHSRHLKNHQPDGSAALVAVREAVGESVSA